MGFEGALPNFLQEIRQRTFKSQVDFAGSNTLTSRSTTLGERIIKIISAGSHSSSESCISIAVGKSEPGSCSTAGTQNCNHHCNGISQDESSSHAKERHMRWYASYTVISRSQLASTDK